ncbi:MAG: tail fiber protein [Anaerolineae bacterium]|jgi:microcystin-dependent protein
MSEPFYAEIRIFAGNFAPRGWAFCDGQLLPVAQNTALFSLLGTTYGGDGRNNFALPNLQGRAPMHPGRGPGLTARRLGELGGSETATISANQLPSHNHSLLSTGAPAASGNPENGSLTRVMNPRLYRSDASNLQGMASQTLDNAGGGQSHNNVQPYLAMYFIIALQGLYPSRS